MPPSKHAFTRLPPDTKLSVYWTGFEKNFDNLAGVLRKRGEPHAAGEFYECVVLDSKPSKQSVDGHDEELFTHSCKYHGGVVHHDLFCDVKKFEVVEWGAWPATIVACEESVEDAQHPGAVSNFLVGIKTKAGRLALRKARVAKPTAETYVVHVREQGGGAASSSTPERAGATALSPRASPRSPRGGRDSQLSHALQALDADLVNIQADQARMERENAAKYESRVHRAKAANDERIRKVAIAPGETFLSMQSPSHKSPRRSPRKTPTRPSPRRKVVMDMDGLETPMPAGWLQMAAPRLDLERDIGATAEDA